VSAEQEPAAVAARKPALPTRPRRPSRPQGPPQKAFGELGKMARELAAAVSDATPSLDAPTSLAEQLFDAVTAGDSTRAMELIGEGAADLPAFIDHEREESALFVACRSGHADVAAVLLESSR